MSSLDPGNNTILRAGIITNETSPNTTTHSFVDSDDDPTTTPADEEEQEQVLNASTNKDGLTTDEAGRLLEEYGPNELPEKIDPKWLVFLRQFWAPMPIMIWIAIVVEASIQNWLDMSILLVIQLVNASISFYETTKAGNAVAALKSSLKPTATCKRDGQWQVIDQVALVPGDLVILGSGSAVPADCRIIGDGGGEEIDVDQAALTGESHPVTMHKGDSVKMGSSVVRGEVEATVEFTGRNTFFGKTAALLGDTHDESSRLQKILMRIMVVLVVLSLVLSTIYFHYLYFAGIGFREALSFTVVVLVASIPLAMEIATTTTLAIGSKDLVQHGAIVAKLSAIEDLAGMSVLCSDKTGTLTLNKMVLQDDTPIYLEGETQATVLMYAALAARWKEPPRDALDRLTLGAVDHSLLEKFIQEDYLPFDPQIKRTEGTVINTETGEVFKTSKGAPHIILSLLPSSSSLVSQHIREKVEADVARLSEQGVRTLAVARTDSVTGEWMMVGLLTFLDPPREDTKTTIEEAREYGVAVKMITGDNLLVAKNTARQLEMGEHILTADGLPLLDSETQRKPENLSERYGDLCVAADGFAQVFPEHKYLIVECLRELGYTTGMTGDGVNDAPALKRADIGIAVAGSTDAARAAADIILTREGLGTIIHAILIARSIFQRISSFITYRIAATLQLLFFFFISIFAFNPDEYVHPDDEMWPRFFHVPVIMLMLITLLNDGTLITIAYDHAEPSHQPDHWNLPFLFVSSSTLGAVSCFSSLLMVHFLMDSWNPHSFLQQTLLGDGTMDQDGGVSYGQIICAVYLKISVSDFLTLFSARTGDQFFWEVRPATPLMMGGCFALLLSSILSIVWPKSEIDGIPTEGLQSNMLVFAFVWMYSILFFLIQDILKVLVNKWMHKINFGEAAAGVAANNNAGVLGRYSRVDTIELV